VAWRKGLSASTNPSGAAIERAKFEARMSQVALIDYGSGNLASAAKALARASLESGAGQEIVTTADPEAVRRAERIVLPGVGAFADCMRGLSAVPGMVAALREKVLKEGAPFLGICVGMQLLATVGKEFGDHPGLGWIAGEVMKIAPSDPALKIPHMGWNELKIVQRHALLDGIEDGAHAYFVHSYQFVPTLPDDLLATTDYGGALTAMIGNENIAGTQFHPEKSQATGLKLLGNFLRWKP
jgi:imidazole glycerol-phosphate synthase subunit HisH